jgi:hypothetical protein
MRRAGLTTVIGTAMLVVSWAMAGGAVAAAGNNGTVKVDGRPFDDLPDNQPHVGCAFQIDFYGYDEGNLFASVSFELDPPTGEMAEILSEDGIFIGEDSAAGGGSTAGLDASRTYDLSAAIAATGEAPHPQQGWHIGLTIHADGSIGSDVKHKEFWVTGCGAYPPSVSAADASVDEQELSSDLSRKPSPPASINLGTAGLVAIIGLGLFVVIRRRVRASVER